MRAPPVYPIRRVAARYDRKRDQWHPCGDEDKRGTLLMDVDAQGRPVMAVSGSPFGDGQTLGWKLCFPTHSQDPAAFVAWMQKHPEIRILK